MGTAGDEALAAALARLEAAVTRLEAAAASAVPPAVDHVTPDAAVPAGDRRQEAAAALDATIGRLRTLLDGLEHG